MSDRTSDRLSDRDAKYVAHLCRHGQTGGFDVFRGMGFSFAFIGGLGVLASLASLILHTTSASGLPGRTTGDLTKMLLTSLPWLLAGYLCLDLARCYRIIRALAKADALPTSVGGQDTGRQGEARVCSNCGRTVDSPFCPYCNSPVLEADRQPVGPS